MHHHATEGAHEWTGEHRPFPVLAGMQNGQRTDSQRLSRGHSRPARPQELETVVSVTRRQVLWQGQTAAQVVVVERPTLVACHLWLDLAERQQFLRLRERGERSLRLRI